VAWLARRGGGAALGARPLRRTVGREVERRLSRMLLAGEVAAGGAVRVDVEGADGALTFTVTGSGGDEHP
jgi:ATP-dependent Clp protease ATP-binding subunit ClpC